MREARVVRFVEGKAVTGEFLVTTLARGEHIVVLEISLPKGVSSPAHAHAHESIIYVIRGRLKTVIDGKASFLGPGDSCVHGRGIEHDVEALEAALFLEIKSPAPNLDDFFRS